MKFSSIALIITIHHNKMTLYKKWKTPMGIVDHLLSIDRILLNTHTVVNEFRYALKEKKEEVFEYALEKIGINTISLKLQTPVKKTVCLCILVEYNHNN